MPTYYKYVEREADSYINWAEVGKSISDTAYEINRVREEKKDAIDTAMREDLNQLAEAPQGEDQNLNKWTLNYASDASNYLRTLNNLLKNGSISVKDYTTYRQNVVDGTDKAFNLSKEFQSIYADKLQRYKNGDSQPLERWLMAQVEGFANFNKSRLLLDDFGNVNVGIMEEVDVDGKKVTKLKPGADNFATINTIRSQVQGKFDRFKSDEALDGLADRVGEEINMQIKALEGLPGKGIVSLSDFKGRPEYQDMITKSVEAIIVNPYNALSVLTSDIKSTSDGVPYTFTYDENQAKSDKKYILLRKNDSGLPEPQLTDEQNAIVRENLKKRLDLRLDKKEQLSQYVAPERKETYRPTQYEYERGDKKKEEQNIGSLFRDIYAGNTGQRSTSIQALKGYYNDYGIADVLETKDGIILRKIIDDDGNTKDIALNFKDKQGNLVSVEDFVKQGITNFGIKDVTIANKFKGQKFNATPMIPDEEPAKSTYDKFAEDNRGIYNYNLLRSNQNNAAQKLQSILPSGYTVEATGTLGNYVKIKKGKKVITEVQTNWGNNIDKAKKVFEQLDNDLQLSMRQNTQNKPTTIKEGNLRK